MNASIDGLAVVFTAGLRFGPAGAFEQKLTVSLFVEYLNRKFLHVYAI
ncbi:hypothetical protein [Photorhabdus sp. SF281]